MYAHTHSTQTHTHAAHTDTRNPCVKLWCNNKFYG